METTKEILTQLKGYFIAGAQPTQAQFEQLIDTYLVSHNNKVGIGTETPQNTLDVSGAVAIGSGHAGDETAPPNGLIVEGNVGLGHNLADEPLHVNGNVRIDSGNLYMGENLVINSDGEWEGVAIDAGNNNNSSTAWNDGLNSVNTNSSVGIGTNQPASQLHVDGDATIENGDLRVSGIINKKDIAFTAHGFREISPVTNQILLQNEQNQHTPHVFWDTDTSVFQPDAAHAGTYCFMVSLTLKAQEVKEDEKREDGEPAQTASADQRVYFVTGSDAANVAEFSEAMPIRESGSSLHASASLMLYMDGTFGIALKTDNPAMIIESISFSGYRI